MGGRHAQPEPGQLAQAVWQDLCDFPDRPVARHPPHRRFHLRWQRGGDHRRHHGRRRGRRVKRKESREATGSSPFTLALYGSPRSASLEPSTAEVLVLYLSRLDSPPPLPLVVTHIIFPRKK